MHTISEELALIINLHNAAIFHKKHCEDENCNVSLMQLKMAAINLNRWTRTWEKDEANKLIKEMPIM